MTIRFRKKNRKWRGRTSRGWGMKKKRRGGGSRGGRGMAGLHKHKFTLVTTKMGNDYYGYKGFHSLKKRDKIINAGEIDKIAKGNREVDLTSLGYTKLLSRGVVSGSYMVKIKKFTKKAKEKIEKSGGKVVTD